MCCVPFAVYPRTFFPLALQCLALAGSKELLSPLLFCFQGFRHSVPGSGDCHGRRGKCRAMPQLLQLSRALPSAVSCG